MDTPVYKELKEETDLSGNEFYLAVAEFRSHPDNLDVRRNAVKLGRQYSNSLSGELSYLQLRSKVRDRAKRERIKARIEELNILSSEREEIGF